MRVGRGEGEGRTPTTAVAQSRSCTLHSWPEAQLR